jgi:hypothetical protein
MDRLKIGLDGRERDGEIVGVDFHDGPGPVPRVYADVCTVDGGSSSDFVMKIGRSISANLHRRTKISACALIGTAVHRASAATNLSIGCPISNRARRLSLLLLECLLPSLTGSLDGGSSGSSRGLDGLPLSYPPQSRRTASKLGRYPMVRTGLSGFSGSPTGHLLSWS